MADIEKVIKAWEIFRDSNPYQICEGIEFRAISEPEYCMSQMIADTLELLKEKQPRVLSFDEMIQIEEEVLVEIRLPSKDRTYLRWCDIVFDEGMSIALYTTHGIHMASDWAYEVRWRCWSEKPTDEQRKAVPWMTCGNCKYFTRNCKDYHGRDGCIYHMSDAGTDDDACTKYDPKEG